MTNEDLEIHLPKMFNEDSILGDWAVIGGRYKELQTELDDDFRRFVQDKIKPYLNEREFSPFIKLYEDGSWGLWSELDIRNNYKNGMFFGSPIRWVVVDYHH